MSEDRRVLLRLHETMVCIRVFEQRAERLFLDKKIPGFIHLYVGQEAIAAGHRPRVVAGAGSEPKTGFFDGEVSDRRFEAVTVRLYIDRSSGAFRSSGSALRKLGALGAKGRVLVGRSSGGCGFK